MTALPASKSAYLVVTTSGKPVFWSCGTDEEASSYSGVIQAITSCFESSNLIQQIETSTLTIKFKFHDPLIFVAINKLSTQLDVLDLHLDLLNAQILSVLTKQQLTSQIESKPNLNLRNVLSGSEVFLNSLVSSFDQAEPWTWLNALEAIEMDQSERLKVHNKMLECRPEALLYGLVLSKSKFVSILRPKLHSLHPLDLYLVVNMIFNTSKFQDGEHWVPICFPKFNQNGFLYAYIRKVSLDGSIMDNNSAGLESSNEYLVLVCPNKHGFYNCQQAAEQLLTKIDSLPFKTSLFAPEFNDISFVYKSKDHVQYVKHNLTPEINAQFSGLNSLMVKRKIRVHLERDNCLMGWFTPTFELYIHANGEIDKHARMVVNHMLKHQADLFLIEGAVF